MQNASRQMEKFAKKMNNIGKTMSTYVTAPLALAGAASIKMASDFEESVNKVDVAFGDASNTVKSFAQTTLQSFGIAEGTALDMAATFGDMATSMGLTQSASADMAKQLVGLAGDLASFKNISIDVANTALTSIFTGETESLKKLGIVMTQANLQAYALSQGITKNIQDMGEAEKVQLRYAYVMAKTTNAQGDFARTGGGAANQMRIFQEGLKQLGQQFGAVILPAFTDLVKSANNLLSSFSNLTDGQKKFIVGMGILAASIGPVLIGISHLTKAAILMKAQVLAIAPAYAAIAAAVVLLSKVIYDAIQRKRKLAEIDAELNKRMDAQAEASKRAAEATSEEVSEIRTLLAVAQDEYQLKETRLNAINKLNSIAPDYIKNINLENVATADVTSAIDKYITSLQSKAKAQAMSTLLSEEMTKQMEIEKEILFLTMQVEKQRNSIIGMSATANEAESQATKTSIQLGERRLEVLQKQSQEIQNNIKDLTKLGAVIQTTETGGTGGGLGKAAESQKAKLLDLNAAVKEYTGSIGELKSTAEELMPTLQAVDQSFEMSAHTAGSWGAKLNEVFEQIGEGLRSLLVDVVADGLERLGETFAGSQTTFRSFGADMLGAVGEFAGKFGKLLMAAGAASLAFQTQLLSGPQGAIAAIAAGAALVVASGAIKQHLKNAKNMGSSGGGSVGSVGGYGGGGGYSAPSGINVSLTGVMVGNDMRLIVNKEYTRTELIRGK